jgi:hypothetical protein
VRLRVPAKAWDFNHKLCMSRSPVCVEVLYRHSWLALEKGDQLVHSFIPFHPDSENRVLVQS